MTFCQKNALKNDTNRTICPKKLNGIAFANVKSYNQKQILTMKTEIQIPKELLAQIDFANTINGGMIETTAQAWQETEGYRMVVNAPTIAADKIRVEVADKRFMVFYTLDVLEGEGQMPYFLVNLPLSPEVDVDGITARFENGKIYIRAPFNGWARGERREIDLT